MMRSQITPKDYANLGTYERIEIDVLLRSHGINPKDVLEIRIYSTSRADREDVEIDVGVSADRGARHLVNSWGIPAVGRPSNKNDSYVHLNTKTVKVSRRVGR